jgi:TrmH family RNA methyltransferase
MITVILVEPEHSGNIGAIARVMANFDLKNLVLINPKCNHLDEEAQGRSKHARDVLKKAKVMDFSCLNDYDYVIGTSAIIGTDYNIPRCPLTPEELSLKLKDRKGKFALVFGREGSGLSNEEISKCDFMVKIPSSSEYPTLNISHAAAIIFYALFKEKGFSHIPAVSDTEKEIILGKIDNLLKGMDFTTPQKKVTQKITWKKIIGKAMLTKREAFVVLGFLRKLEK